jgi:hypothetical protein
MPTDDMVLPVHKMRELVEDFGDGALDRAGQGMIRLLGILEAKAVELAPADTGNLEASTSVRILENSKDRVRGELAFSTPYAARIHEMPEGSRGPKTQAKTGNEYGVAGPKYLERPLRGMQKEMPEAIAKIMRRDAAGVDI